MASRAEAAPAFQCYPADVLADTAELTHEELGMYWRLAMYAWRERGIPTDPARLARLLGVTSAKLAKAWPILGARFTRDGDRLVLAWMEDERTKQAQNRVKRRGAANARWHPEEQSTRNAHALQTECLASASASAVAVANAPQRESGGNGASPSGPDPLPPAARRLLAHCYAKSTAEKRAAAAAELLAMLTPDGAVYQRQPTRARDVAQLERACTAVLARPPRNLERAVVFVHQKLRDDTDAEGRTPSEAHAASERASRQREEREAARVAVDVDTWCAAHSGEAMDLAADVNAALADIPEGPIRERSFRAMLATKVRAAAAREAAEREREVAHVG